METSRRVKFYRGKGDLTVLIQDIWEESEF
jgi:hypothetical protein